MAHTSAQATVRCYSEKNQTNILKKNAIFLLHVSRLPCPREAGQPLTTWAKAWQAIPGVSEWVMGIIKRGYSLQFTRRPPHFSGVVSTSVQSENTHILRSEVMILLEKRSNRKSSSSSERFRLLQPLLPCTQKGW